MKISDKRLIIFIFLLKKVKVFASWITLRKHAYSNILKILSLKNENCQIKNSDIFHFSAQKHRLWVLIRTASVRQF